MVTQGKNWWEDESRAPKLNPLTQKAPMDNTTVTLKRTFNMTLEGVTLKFWRVMGPTTHRNYHSDLSLDGLREWGIIQ